MEPLHNLEDYSGDVRVQTGDVADYLPLAMEILHFAYLGIIGPGL